MSRLFLALIFLLFTLSAFEYSLANKPKRNWRYYYELGIDFMEKGSFKAAIPALERALRSRYPEIKYYATAMLSQAWAQLGDYERAFYWTVESTLIRFPSNESHIQSDMIRERMTKVHLPEYRHCFAEAEPIDEEFWKYFKESIDAVWLTRRDPPNVRFWLSSLSPQAVGCFLNRTFPLDEYYLNVLTQSQFYALLEDYPKMEQLFRFGFDYYSSAPSSVHQLFEQYLVRSYFSANQLDKGGSRIKEVLLKTASNSERTHNLLAYMFHQTGDTKRLEKSVINWWKVNFKTWLNEPSISGCTRKIVNSLFVDADVDVSDPIRPDALRTFGNGRPKFIQTPENSANPITARNLTYNDKSVHLLRLKQVSLISESQFQSDCKLYLSYLTSEHLKPTSNTSVVQLGRVAFTNPIHDVYFHFVIEHAARLLILVGQVFSKPEFSDVRLLCFDRPFIRDFLRLLRFPEARVIWMRPHEHTYKIEELFVVDWKRNYDPTINDRAIQYFSPPGWLISHLSNTYSTRLHTILPGLKQFDESNDQPIRVVYVSRRHSTDQVRAVEHEDWLLYHLRRALDVHSVQLLVHTGAESVLKQALMFYQADLVVGPHGSGLANLIFCRSGTAVVEFPLTNNVIDVFGPVISALNLDYWIVPELSSHVHGNYRLNRQSIDAVVDTVLEALRSQELIDR